MTAPKTEPEVMTQLVEANLGGAGYRDWLGERFEPQAAQSLQEQYDKLVADITADALRRMAGDRL